MSVAHTTRRTNRTLPHPSARSHAQCRRGQRGCKRCHPTAATPRAAAGTAAATAAIIPTAASVVSSIHGQPADPEADQRHGHEHRGRQRARRQVGPVRPGRGVSQAARQSAAPAARTRPAPRRNGPARSPARARPGTAAPRTPPATAGNSTAAARPGADDQVGSGMPAVARNEANRASSSSAGSSRPGQRRFGGRAGGGGDLGTRAVGQGDHQVQLRIPRRIPFRLRQIALDVRIKTTTIADEAQPHAGGVEFGDFTPQEMTEQPGEVQHLGGRTPPVLAGERVDGQPLHARADGRLDGAPDRLRAGPMAGDFAAARARPPSGRCRP